MTLTIVAPALEITALTPAIGAVVGGIDLAQPLGDALRQALREALLRHHVLFFRDQALTPAAQRDFAAAFGELHIHPIYPQADGVAEIIVLDTHDDNPQDSDVWHTDVPFLARPAAIAILAAQLLPPLGGDTLFASCIAAYDSLPAPLQALLDPLEAEQDMVKSFPRHRYGQGEDLAKWEAAVARNPPVVHPAVRVHPETGRRGLFVNEGFTTRIVGLRRSESDALLNLLFQHIARPEHTVRWRWRLGDVAMWDNRLTQHYAVADYRGQRRIMHRATVLGDRPFGIAGASAGAASAA